MAETWVSLPELEALIGKDMAATLCRVRGGSPVYVPVKATPEHDLARTIGVRAMEMLCAEFSCMHITVPNGRKAEPYKIEIMNRLAQGQSHRSIALDIGVTERYVRMVAASQPVQQQLTLPF